MPAALALPANLAPVVLILAGALFAFAAGPIMSLPSTVLAPQARAFGMGVFFSIYYAVMMVAPGLAGGLAESLGDRSIVFALGAAMATFCIVALALFRRAEARPGVGLAP